MLTAHHLDDQIENFYIRLSRGSGLQGLSSMKIAEKNKEKITIVRPFLSSSKNRLLKKYLPHLLKTHLIRMTVF